MEKTWLKHYDPRVSAEIDADRYASVVDIFEQSVKKFKNKEAFINMGHSISFEELDTLSAQFAAYLQASGLKRGDAVAIMMPNLLQYPVAMFGILRAGMVVVNVNPLYTARELKHQLNDANAKAIVIVENFACTLEEVIADTNLQEVFLTALGDMLPAPKRWIVNAVVKYVKKMVPSFTLPETTSFMSAVKKGQSLKYTRPEIDSGDIAFLQYTGGTTGVSKGAMLTHRNMVANLEQVSGILETVIEEGEDFVVTALPLYHIFALLANCLMFVKYGCRNLLITNPRDMPAFVNELSKYPFTILPGVNTLFNGLLNTPGFDELDFSKFKFGLGGGMAVQRPVAEKWEKVTGTVLLEGYGLTECSPVVAVNPPQIEAYKGAIGMPVPSTDIKLLDDDGNPVEKGEPGEMWVKGPQVMMGYWQRQDETDKCMKRGFFKTGDVGLKLPSGNYKIVDRLKDMIIVSGFNVYPNEVENVLCQHPAICEAAVIGAKDEKTGERVCAYITLKEHIDEQQVSDYCRENLSAYKVPKSIIFMEQLPKSTVGKILRRELRQQ